MPQNECLTDDLSRLNRAIEMLGLSREELAAIARVHPHALRLTPGAIALQAAVEQLIQVHALLTESGHVPEGVAFSFRNRPLRGLGHKTAYEHFLAGEGRSVIGYLASNCSGYVG